MNLFKQGRKPFLEFLRNMTVQAVILAMALFAARGLEFSCCDFNNTKQTVLFTILFLIFLSAWIASSLQFFEDYLFPPGFHRKMYERLKSPRYSWKFVFEYTWRRNRLLIPESLFVFGLIQMSMVIVMAHSVFMATGFLKLMK